MDILQLLNDVKFEHYPNIVPDNESPGFRQSVKHQVESLPVDFRLGGESNVPSIPHRCYTHALNLKYNFLCHVLDGQMANEFKSIAIDITHGCASELHRRIRGYVEKIRGTQIVVPPLDTRIKAVCGDLARCFERSQVVAFHFHGDIEIFEFPDYVADPKMAHLKGKRRVRLVRLISDGVSGRFGGFLHHSGRLKTRENHDAKRQHCWGDYFL